MLFVHNWLDTCYSYKICITMILKKKKLTCRLTLIPRHKRLYVLMSSTLHMKWHSENTRNNGIMTYLSHSKIWQYFNQTCLDFASVSGVLG